MLKQVGLKKNAEFRDRFVGETLSAVTIENSRAVTSNYLTVELASPRPAREIVDLRIGTTTEAGLKEHSPFTVLPQESN